ncbi:MAG: hypothetical protein Q7U23_00760 [Methylococcales bacterium]|nr:hypothetical protein [Methylococcales bacterium]
MLIFISLSLVLCYLVQVSISLPAILTSEYFVYGGLGIALISILGMFFKKLPNIVGYDGFSSGTLLLWFAYWKPMPFFTSDSPIFFFFPLYFALMSAFITLFLSNQNHRIDKESLGYMRTFDREKAIPAWALMLCVLGSVEVTQHYQLYPVMMTLLMLRFALSSCVEEGS